MHSPRSPWLSFVLAGLVWTAVALPTRAADAPASGWRRWLTPSWYGDQVRVAVADLRTPEWVDYIQWNLTGQGQGWFRPGESRHGWPWLARHYDADGDGIITRQEFRGPPEWFKRLDRDGSGTLTAADFDWSLPNPADLRAGKGAVPGRPGQPFDREAMLQKAQQVIAMQLFQRADADRNGKLSRQEWLDLFTRAAKGKDHLTPEDLREILAATLPGRPQGMEMPRESLNLIRVAGMFKGETGSIFEGPRVGQRAPDFTLPTHDGKREIRLSDYRGKKPVVLVFGNYT